MTDDTSRTGGGKKGPTRGRGKKAPIRAGAVIAVALLAAFISWAVIHHSGNKASTTTNSVTTTTPTTGPVVTSKVGPVAVSKDALSALAASVGHTVYWAGPIRSRAYEFTRTSNDLVYVRYLPKSVKVGDKPLNFLIVATYPFRDPYTALQKVAKGKGVKIPGGGIAVVDTRTPRSVHFAFPGVNYQGEIYDPSPAKSLEVATSGALQPVP